MSWACFYTVVAAISAMAYAATGRPLHVGAAVLFGLAAIVLAIDEARP